MLPYRAVFKNEILGEFIPPRRKSRRVILLLSGFPSTPCYSHLLRFLAKKGFWAFGLRYRGSWESRGIFLKNSPHLDALEVCHQLPYGFLNLYTKEKIKLNPSRVYILGSSFGGAGAIICSLDKMVDKVVAFSPVVDWQSQFKREKENFREFILKSFGYAYRISNYGWRRLERGLIYNPVNYIGQLEGRKIMIIHSRDDEIVRFGTVKNFARQISAYFILLNKGGHFSLSAIRKPSFYKRFKKFISS